MDARFRIGYGGGYFDRTLAAATPRPFSIGVGFEFQRLETIYRQLFDIPMDLIFTETSNLTTNSTTPGVPDSSATGSSQGEVRSLANSV